MTISATRTRTLSGHITSSCGDDDEDDDDDDDDADRERAKQIKELLFKTYRVPN